MTDDDALAIKAYLFSLQPVEAPRPVNTLAFPFNQRWLMGFWSFFFNPDKRFEANTERSAEWNRGAYLAEAMAHCGECHTPRSLAFSLDNRHKFAGAKQAGWVAYNISTDKQTGIGEWSPAQIAKYISTGHATGRGTADGPMGEAVEYSLSYLTQADIAAVAAYVASVPPVTGKDQPVVKNAAAPDNHNLGVTASIDPRGKEIYEGACVSCHGWSGNSPILAYANLTGARAVNDPTATNVVQIVVAGTTQNGVHGGLYMPDFGDAYSDTEIAAVANYVTARFGSEPSNLTAAMWPIFARKSRNSMRGVGRAVYGILRPVENADFLVIGAASPALPPPTGSPVTGEWSCWNARRNRATTPPGAPPRCSWRPTAHRKCVPSLGPAAFLDNPPAGFVEHPLLAPRGTMAVATKSRNRSWKNTGRRSAAPRRTLGV